MHAAVLARACVRAALLPLTTLHRTPAVAMHASRDELAALTVVALKERLRASGRPVSGKKAELIERLMAPAPPPTPPRSSAAPSRRRDRGAGRTPIAMDATPRRGSSAAGTRRLRAVSWNIAGLRGLLKRDEGRASLRTLVDSERVDLLLLQETKLQPSHVAEVEAALLGLLGGDEWRAAWACSTARKGYSGVATLWRRGLGEAACAPLVVDPGHEAEREGRTLLWEIPTGGGGALKLLNVYVPNSGAALQRLDYRTAEGGWDARLRLALAGAAADGAHVCVGGDMNVAVEDVDFHNPTAAHVTTQAGTTPEERASLRRFLAPPLHMRDAFRLLWPDARGQYTYWSQRAVARPVNRGLRIDYFLLGSSVPTAAVLDAQHLQQLHGSDHAPILLDLDLARL